MVLLSLVTLALASSSPQVSLAAPGLQNANADPKVVGFFNEYFAQQLVLQGLRVTTANEIQSLIGFERQKQLLGCTDASSSCLAELAGALGVDGLVTGSVAKFGNTFAINLKIVSAQDSRALSAASARLEGEREVLDWLTHQAKVSAAEVQRGLGGARPSAPAAPPAAVVAATAPPPTEQGSKLRPYAWLPATGGAAALAIGGLVYTASAGARAEPPERELPPGESLTSYVDSNAALERAGLALGGLGLLGLAAGATMFLLPAEDAPAVSAIVHPTGGALTFTSTFP